MAQSNLAAVVETPEQKLARLEAENKALQSKNGTVSEHVPRSVGFTLVSGGKGIMAGEAMAKTFKSGSTGFYASTKVSIGGRRYQTSVMLVEIGSKPVA